MNLDRAYRHKAVIEVGATEVDTIVAALTMYHRDQQNAQTPFGIRITDLKDEFQGTARAIWEQDARCRGLVVEDDEPVAGGAF